MAHTWLCVRALGCVVARDCPWGCWSEGLWAQPCAHGEQGCASTARPTLAACCSMSSSYWGLLKGMKVSVRNMVPTGCGQVRKWAWWMQDRAGCPRAAGRCAEARGGRGGCVIWVPMGGSRPPARTTHGQGGAEPAPRRPSPRHGSLCCTGPGGAPWPPGAGRWGCRAAPPAHPPARAAGRARGRWPGQPAGRQQGESEARGNGSWSSSRPAWPGQQPLQAAAAAAGERAAAAGGRGAEQHALQGHRGMNVRC
jgi:hypothetical protein